MDIATRIIEACDSGVEEATLQFEPSATGAVHQ